MNGIMFRQKQHKTLFGKLNWRPRNQKTNARRLNMSLNLPGQAIAEELGYSLLAYGGNKQSATYVKDGIWLKVYADSTAELSSLLGIVTLSIGGFQFPHPHFGFLEKQIRSIIDN